MAEHVVKEAKRCLKCKKPSCSIGCPVNTEIPKVIELFLDGRIKQAGEILFKNNPLSVVCSLVCPHESQCEGNCILRKKSNSIQFSSIEHYISYYYLNVMDLKPQKQINKKIGIIGSGPAGITIAFLLALKGYQITIFEAHDKIGGILRYGIPEFRLPKDILEKLKQKLIEIGVKIRPNTLIGPIITLDDLFRDGFKALFIGTGVWKPNKLNIKGESLGHVHFAMDFLKNPQVYDLGNTLCVIGAGNVAMDVARTAARNGVMNVIVMYRKGLEDMSASDIEIEYAKLDGVRFELYKTPIEILDTGVRYLDTEIVKNNDKEVLMNVKNSEKILKADSIIIAIGQGPRANIVSTTKGIELNNNGLVITDEYGRTTKKGVFASGDVVTGAKTVVEAVRVSKRVAEAIDDYLKNN